jgi:zinc transport system ATP-binding protein
MKKKAAIAISRLEFGYEKASLLRDVNLTINEGEFVGVFGPNGGGKTTLLKLIMGFLTPRKGKVKLFGTSPSQARGQIGYVPQVSLFDKQFPISVLDVVLMGCLSEITWWGSLSKKTRQRAEEALDQVGLLHKAASSFGTLSGGQQQRTLIARALVSRPKLLLLDEPTASVDQEAEHEIYARLMQIKGSLTILMVTHDLSQITQKADKLLCVQHLVTPFSPDEVCKHYSIGLY